MFFGSMVKMTEPEATQWMWQKLAGHSEKVFENNKYSPHYANVAATLQYLFEESILFAISQMKLVLDWDSSQSNEDPGPGVAADLRVVTPVGDPV